jgi:hypothetical protein
MQVTSQALIDGLTATLLLVTGVVGVIEAMRRDEAGLALLFLVMVVVSVGAVGARRSGRRRSLLVRADLHRWLEQTAAVTGESLGDVADRCISACRAETGT